MKILGTLLLMTGFFVLTSCDQPTPEKAADYYDSIVKKTNVLVKKYEPDLINSFTDYIPEEMSAKLAAFETYVKELDAELKTKKDYFGDNSLLKAAQNLVDGYIKVIPLYAERVEIESLPDSLFTNEMGDRSYDIEEEIDIILNTLNEIYIKDTREFAAKNNFPIKEDDDDLDLDI